MLANQKIKKFTDVLPCTLAMIDCRQLEDVSSIENVHMVTEILSQIFIRCCLLHLPSLSCLCHMHLVHFNSRDYFIWLHILCSHVESSLSHTSMHQTSPAISPWTKPWSPDRLCAAATMGVLFWIPWIEPLTWQLRAVESEQSTISTPKLLTATIANYCPAFHFLDHAMHKSHRLLVDLKACTLPTCYPSLC